MPHGRLLAADSTVEPSPVLQTLMNTNPPTRVLVMTLNSLAGGGQRAAGAGRPRAIKDPKKSSLSRRGKSVIALSSSRLVRPPGPAGRCRRLTPFKASVMGIPQVHPVPLQFPP